MATVLYRLTSGEVLKISEQNNPFNDRDTRLYGMQQDPPFPDGTTLRPTNPDGSLGPLRVLGYAKHWDGTNCRNATQPEIDGYPGYETTDVNNQDASRAADLGDTDPIWRKLVKAIIKQAIRENNIQATQFNALRDEILNATSLGQLQDAIQTNTQEMPHRTYQQGYDAIRNDIDPNE